MQQLNQTNISSVLIISISLIGLVLPSTWVISALSKHLTTSTIASTSLMWDRNLLPKPSPLLAPLTSPAISVNSKGSYVFWRLRQIKKWKSSKRSR